MTQEDRKLFLIDLSARLPYRVKVTWDNKHPLTVTPYIYCAIASENNKDALPKLLLRPMSSMTEEEEIEYDATFATIKNADGHYDSTMTYKSFDFLNVHHLDYRSLIEKGLALEAPENMYSIESKE